MTTQTTTSPYTRAADRVSTDNALLPYADICLYDWSEGDEHYTWIADAPSSDIVEWAQGIRDEQIAEVGE